MQRIFRATIREMRVTIQEMRVTMLHCHTHFTLSHAFAFDNVRSSELSKTCFSKTTHISYLESESDLRRGRYGPDKKAAVARVAAAFSSDRNPTLCCIMQTSKIKFHVP